jgi:hypothetical protein
MNCASNSAWLKQPDKQKLASSVTRPLGLASESCSGMGFPSSTAIFGGVDEEVVLTPFFGQAHIVSLPLLVFLFQWIALGLRTVLLRRQRREGAVGPLSPPESPQLST